MELGFTDILLVLIVGAVGLLVFRRRLSKRAVMQPVKLRRPTGQELEDARRKKNRRLQLRIIAGALLVTGAVVLLDATGVLKMLTMGYILSGTLLIGGTTLFVLSARR